MKVDTKLSPQGYLYENDGALHPFWEQDGGGGGGTGTIPDITATATVDGTTGTPAVEVTQTGDHGENIDFAFSGLKGEKGDKGDVGPAGPEGPQGPKGEDGTSVNPSNIVKNVTMDATPNVTMGTTDYDLAYRTNDDQKHNAQTVHLATKQLVLENARTSAGTNSTDKIGEITLYTIDQTGNEGSQSFGIVAITQSDGSVSLCPALNKDGNWEYGQEFLKIPYVPKNYVKEAAVGAPNIENNMKYYPYREVSVKDGVEQHETTTNIGTLDPEYMVENVLLDDGLTAPSGKYTTNKATFKTRWNHGGVVTEQTDVFAVNAPITDKNYTDVTMTSATTGSGTTYSLKKIDMDGKEANIGTIEIPKAGGGGSETKTFVLDHEPILGVCLSASQVRVAIPTGTASQSITTSKTLMGNFYKMDGTLIAENIATDGSNNLPGWYQPSFTLPNRSLTVYTPVLFMPTNYTVVTVAPTQTEALIAHKNWMLHYDIEHNRYNFDTDKKKEVR